MAWLLAAPAAGTATVQRGLLSSTRSKVIALIALLMLGVGVFAVVYVQTQGNSSGSQRSNQGLTPTPISQGIPPRPDSPSTDGTSTDGTPSDGTSKDGTPPVSLPKDKDLLTSGDYTAAKPVTVNADGIFSLPSCVVGTDGIDRPGGELSHIQNATIQECYNACYEENRCAFFNMRSNIPNISTTDQTGCYLKTAEALNGMWSQDLSSFTYDILPCKYKAYSSGTCLPTKPLNAAAPLADAYNRTLIAYTRWKDNTMCKYLPGLVDPYLNLAITPMKVKFDVEIVYGDFTCGACTEEPTCQLWHPDPRGNYQPFCSMTATGSEFEVDSTWPGYEVSESWGYEIFTHIHYACCCGESCVLNKMYFQNHTFSSDIDPRLVPSTPENVATQLDPNTWRYTIKIPYLGERWWPTDDPRDISYVRSQFQVPLDVQTWEVRPCCDPSGYPDKAIGLIQG